MPTREPAPPDLPHREKHETVRLLFVAGSDHREAPEYATMRHGVDVGAPLKGRPTLEDVSATSANCALYRSVAVEGYRAAAERGHAEIDEARLFVTRDGRLCHGRHGRHRIPIADLLGIRWVPMVLLGVHPGWVEQLCDPRDWFPHRALTTWVAEHDGLWPRRSRVG